MESMDERKNAIEKWLTIDCGLQTASLHAVLGDASFRRYFRIYCADGSYIVMDAPATHENCISYVAIADALRNMGLNTPKIIKSNFEQGFLLISDFGDLTFLKILSEKNSAQLYRDALSALSLLQQCKSVPGHTIPFFTSDFMWKEWVWHKEWFTQKLLGLNTIENEKKLDDCFSLIVESAVAQPQVFMHRDYHSANLMMLQNNEVGLLDFQDAFIGPITYDLVSLLRDCYIDWPEDFVLDNVREYWQQLKHANVISEDFPVFLRWFDWMGLQRHLKALLTFARKHVRDGQTHYLKNVPRTLTYLMKVSERYPECTALYNYLKNTVQPAFPAPLQSNPN